MMTTVAMQRKDRSDGINDKDDDRDGDGIDRMEFPTGSEFECKEAQLVEVSTIHPRTLIFRVYGPLGRQDPGRREGIHGGGGDLRSFGVTLKTLLFEWFAYVHRHSLPPPDPPLVTSMPDGEYDDRTPAGICCFDFDFLVLLRFRNKDDDGGRDGKDVGEDNARMVYEFFVGQLMQQAREYFLRLATECSPCINLSKTNGNRFSIYYERPKPTSVTPPYRHLVSVQDNFVVTDGGSFTNTRKSQIGDSFRAMSFDYSSGSVFVLQDIFHEITAGGFQFRVYHPEAVAKSSSPPSPSPLTVVSERSAFLENRRRKEERAKCFDHIVYYRQEDVRRRERSGPDKVISNLEFCWEYARCKWAVLFKTVLFPSSFASKCCRDHSVIFPTTATTTTAPHPGPQTMTWQGIAAGNPLSSSSVKDATDALSHESKDAFDAKEFFSPCEWDLPRTCCHLDATSYPRKTLKECANSILESIPCDYNTAYFVWLFIYLWTHSVALVVFKGVDHPAKYAFYVATLFFVCQAISIGNHRRIRIVVEWATKTNNGGDEKLEHVFLDEIGSLAIKGGPSKPGGVPAKTRERAMYVFFTEHAVNLLIPFGFPFVVAFMYFNKILRTYGMTPKMPGPLHMLLAVPLHRPSFFDMLGYLIYMPWVVGSALLYAIYYGLWYVLGLFFVGFGWMPILYFATCHPVLMFFVNRSSRPVRSAGRGIKNCFAPCSYRLFKRRG